MRARTGRRQARLLVASLTVTMVLLFVGSGVAYGLATDSAPRVDGEHGMRGWYSTRGLGVGAATTASFLVPKFDAGDCGPTDEAWVERRVYRDTQDGNFYVQIWTHCTSGRITAGGWWVEGGPIKGHLPEMSPGDRLTVTSVGSSGETRISVHNLDRGWVEDSTSPSAPSRRGYTVFANHVWDGSLPFLEHASFKRLKIDGRPFGEYEPKSSEGDCSHTSPLRHGTSFHVTYDCSPVRNAKPVG